MKQKKPRRPNGFTLIELLVVIVVIMVLVGLLMPTLHGTRKQAKVRQARAEMTAIKAAIENYRFSNREWPCNTHDKDVMFSADGMAGSMYKAEGYAVLVDELTDAEPPYLALRDFRVENNRILDPWGTPYLVALDSDYDGELRLPSEWHENEARDRIVTKKIVGAAIWSCGPDGLTSWPADNDFSARKDDARSWTE